ncbi:MAG: 23S rRNA (pseudouridine(1915)-N(3))-methyltransferase RlmH [Breznakibacter sp.]
MKIVLVWIGKTTEAWLQSGISEYLGRLKYYIPVEVKEISALRNTKSLTLDQIKEKEGELVLSTLMPGDHLLLLDESGKQLSSRGFAAEIENHINLSTKRMVFVIGGAYGFSDAVYKSAKQRISLSKLTFSHQMVRVIFLEQMYRGMTILKGEPYHHD